MQIIKKIAPLQSTLLCISLWAWTLGMSGQQYNFQSLGLEEGLPSLAIQKVVQGPDDYLWMATEGAGLVRYDGHDFLSLRNEDQPVINDLEVDSQGRLWYSSERRLTMYDGRSFQDFHLPQGQRIAHLAMGQAPLVVVRSGQMYQLRGDSLQLLGRAPRNLRSIRFYQDSLFAASDAGLLRWQNPGWDTLHHEPLHQLLSFQGLAALGPEGFYPRARDTVNTFREQKFSGARAFGEELLLWRSSSLYWLQKSDTLQLRPENGLEPSVQSAFSDRKGSLLIVNERGLQIFPGREIQRYPTGERQVFAVHRWNGQLTGGTSEGLLSWKDEGFEQYYPAVGFVLALTEMQGDFYVGAESGLYRYSDEGMEHLPLESNEFVFSMLAQDGQLWLGTGLGIFSLKNGRVRNRSAEEGLLPATIYSIKEAPDGSLWFASYTQGFFRYHRGEWEHLREMQTFQLDSMRSSTFLPISKNEIWLGTQNGGLYHLAPSGVQHYDFSTLHFAEVRALTAVPSCENANGRDIWVGTNKGTIPLREILQRAELGGRLPLPFLGGAVSSNAMRYQDGQLLLGCAENILVIEPCQYMRSKQEPQVKISDLRLLMSQEAEPSEFAEKSTPFSGLPENPVFPYDRNYLTISYGVRNLYRPQELRYRYRLKGQEEQWTEAANRREAIYPDLGPDKYVFEVQARRPGRSWQAPVQRYPFQIKAPYYTRWWFIALVVLALGSIASLFIYERLKRINQKLKLENELMEMERKALRLQMNPHFIFNALDSISSFIFKKDPRQAIRYLNNFAKLMRGTLESSMEPLHAVEEEISILKNYLELEKLRFSDRFDYEIELDPEIDYDVGLPPMLVQPHVENAILHGLKPRKEGGHLKIRFALEGELLCITIEDNGVGRETSRQSSHANDHRSMATQINRDRLRLLRSSRSDKIDLHIEDLYAEDGSPKGTRVILKLPAESI